MRSSVNWLDILDWSFDEIENLRFAGYLYVKQGKYDIALTYFEALSILSPNNSYELQTLGAIYLQKGKNLEALNYLDQALKIDPSHYPTQLNKAKALLSLGYKKQAFNQAKTLENCKDLEIASQATAILLSF
ncbi:MAG: tetratricopeptide repeat protein [Chlamydiota bacterium]